MYFYFGGVFFLNRIFIYINVARPVRDLYMKSHRDTASVIVFSL